MSDTEQSPTFQRIYQETLLEVFPAHVPRARDPHYHIFNETRARLKKLGALKCWIGNADCSLDRPIELHHALVEFGLLNAVDWQHFAQLYPEFHITSDEDFLNAIETEGGLLPLCVRHHRGTGGIHFLPYPMWLPQRFLKAGIPVPGRLIRLAADGNPIPDNDLWKVLAGEPQGLPGEKVSPEPSGDKVS